MVLLSNLSFLYDVNNFTIPITGEEISVSNKHLKLEMWGHVNLLEGTCSPKQLGYAAVQSVRILDSCFQWPRRVTPDIPNQDGTGWNYV